MLRLKTKNYPRKTINWTSVSTWIVTKYVIKIRQVITTQVNIMA